MYFATVACPTSMPSLSSSPWIRGAPQSGFATLSLSGLRRRVEAALLPDEPVVRLRLDAVAERERSRRRRQRGAVTRERL
jgi:hypothetical protein